MGKFKEFLLEASMKNKLKKTIAKAVKFFDKSSTMNTMSFVVPVKEDAFKLFKKLENEAKKKYDIFINDAYIADENVMDMSPDFYDDCIKFIEKDLSLETEGSYNFITGIGYEADIEDFCLNELKTKTYAVKKWEY
jgi:hypothetical protein